jgi:hypothetical protein
MKARNVRKTSRPCGIFSQKRKKTRENARRYQAREELFLFPREEEIALRCPSCGGRGTLASRQEPPVFLCSVCCRREAFPHHREAFLAQGDHEVYKVDECCVHCGRHFRIEIQDAKAREQPVLRIACPHCAASQNAKMRRAPADDHYRIRGNHVRWQNELGELRSGRYFGLELYYQTSLNGHVLWAYNRNHLLRIIDYLKAGLREKPLPGWFDEFRKLPGTFKRARYREILAKRLWNLLRLP